MPSFTGIDIYILWSSTPQPHTNEVKLGMEELTSGRLIHEKYHPNWHGPSKKHKMDPQNNLNTGICPEHILPVPSNYELLALWPIIKHYSLRQT